MAYQIKASYSTGDSFHTEDTTTVLSPVWKNLDAAKKALQWLKEHHQYYEVYEDSRRSYKNIVFNIDEAKLKSWFVQPESWPEGWTYYMKLPLDDGTLFNTDIPYHGHFEHLYSLEIESETDSDMKVSF